MSDFRSTSFLPRSFRSGGGTKSASSGGDRTSPGSAPDFLDYLAIKNVLALYCVALDTKDFELLHDVFTPDAELVYPFATMKGVDELAYRLSRRLVPTTTQHALTTQHINFPPVAAQGGGSRKKGHSSSGNSGPSTASVMTYFTATHFGKGRWTGVALTTYGKFVDELVRFSDDEDGEEYDSAGPSGGQWRICRRETKVMATVGDERIVTHPG